MKVEADYQAKAIGRPGALVDEAGAMAPSGIALGSTKGVAEMAGSGVFVVRAAQKAWNDICVI